MSRYQRKGDGHKLTRYESILDLPPRNLWNAYKGHKLMAGRRGIAFKLSFKQWLSIWQRSGRLAERGTGRLQYVMARKGDLGAYETGNVEIVTAAKNARDATVRAMRRMRKTPVK